jgi:hypothetical protein
MKQERKNGPGGMRRAQTEADDRMGIGPDQQEITADSLMCGAGSWSPSRRAGLSSTYQ